MINSKSIARIAAVQAIYCYELGNKNLENLILELIYYYTNDKSIDQDIKINKPYFTKLLTSAVNNMEETDDLIENALKSNWKICSLNKTLLSILRIGACELKMFQEVSHKIVISEFTTIADSMLSEIETGFVNGVLQKIRSNFCSTLPSHIE